MERKLYRSSLYTLVLIAAIVLLVATLAVSLVAQRRAAESIGLVHRAHVVLGELYELNTRLNMVETVLRGYILTGDDRYLKTFQTAKADVDRQLERLHELTRENAVGQEQIMQLSVMTAVKMMDLDRAAALRAKEGFSAAQAIERSDFGKTVMDGIREQVREMIAEGKQALDAQRRTLGTSFRRTNFAIGSAGLVAMGIACVASFLLWIALGAARREERLECQKVRAERADLQKSRFLANMSHEIRTPMNAILGFGELLDGIVSDPKARRYIAAIRSSGESLLSLINDILDISKVEAGHLELHPEPASVGELADGLRTLFAEEALKKGLAFDVSVTETVPKMLVIDTLRVRQIFMNLLSNAMKFTSKGRVRVRIWSEGDPKDGFVDLNGEVEDTGCGIRQEDQKHIFKPFRQAPGSQSGTGLGLSICHRLAGLMGGKITLDSQPGVGSRFCLHLPQVALPLPKEDGSETPTDRDDVDFRRLKPAKIVIADDNTLNRELLAEIFEGTGHEVLFANDGKEAVEIAARSHPDVVLMDVRMPVMDGREARRKLRERRDTANIPVIAVTASSMSPEEQQLRRLFDGFIRKPFSRADVMNELSRFLQSGTASPAGPSVEASGVAPEDDPGRWPKMLGILNAYADGRVHALRQVMGVNAITDFAASVEALGHECRCQAVARYGRRLRHAASAFDVEGMDERLGAFDALVERVETALGHSSKIADDTEGPPAS